MAIAIAVIVALFIALVALGIWHAFILAAFMAVSTELRLIKEGQEAWRKYLEQEGEKRGKGNLELTPSRKMND